MGPDSLNSLKSLRNRSHEAPDGAGLGGAGLPARSYERLEERCRQERLNRPLFEGFTIDGASSLDLDDMLGVRTLGSDTVVEISITNPGAVISPGEDFDLTAREQGETIYLPGDQNKPMLRRSISEGLLSLLPNQEVPTCTISVPFSRSLAMGKPELDLSRGRSTWKHDYKSATRAVTDPSDKYHTEMKKLAEISESLLNSRREKGAIAFCDLQRGIVTTEEGISIRVKKQEIHAHIIVQEMMILANRAVAIFMNENEIPAIYRNHTSRLGAGQDRGEVLRRISEAFHLETPDGIMQSLQRLSSTMNRAEYGAELQGHYALNVSAYMHFTSPLRRYGDLVNHRNLTAALKGEAPPHSSAELSEIAGEINQRVLDIKTRKARYYKKQSKEKSEQLLKEGGQDFPEIGQLSPSALSKILKSACRGIPPEPFAAELIKRLEAGALTDPDIRTILFETSPREAWQDVHDAALMLVARNPHAAITQFNLLAQALAINPPEFTTTKSGPSHAPSFRSLVEVKYNEVDYTAECERGKNRKEAEQLAALRLLLKIFDRERFEADARTTVVSAPQGEPLPQAPGSGTSSQAPDVANPRGVLQEFCQDKRLAFPTLQLVREGGTDHAKEFTYRMALTIDGKSFASDEQSASTKKVAEKAAARDLVGKLLEAGYPILKGEESTEEISHVASQLATAPGDLPQELSSAKSTVNELCQRLAIVPPVYKLVDSGGAAHEMWFEYEGSVKIGEQLFTSDRHRGENKKFAEKLAAHDLLLQLREAGAFGSAESTSPDSEDSVAGDLSELRERVREQPELHTPNAKGRLFELCQANAWPMPEFVRRTLASGSHEPIFEVVATITTPTGEVSSSAQYDENKKGAEHRAANDLLVTLKEDTSTLVPGTTPQPKTPDHRSLGSIEAFLKAQGIQSSAVQYLEREANPEELWIVEVNLTTKGGVHISEWGTGQTEVFARYAAAGQVLEQLRGMESMGRIEPDKRHPMSALQTYSRWKRVQAPNVKIIAEGASDDTLWQCACDFEDQDGSPQKISGFGSSKKDAAAKLLMELKSHFSN